MKGYSRLHHARVHTHESPPTSVIPLHDNTEAEYAGVQKWKEEVQVFQEGSCSGRLGAAVQRALAMRERLLSSASQNDLTGIGAMRELCISWVSPNSIASTERCAVYGEQIRPCVVGTQSMRYRRFSPDMEGFNRLHGEDVGRLASPIPTLTSFGEKTGRNGGAEKKKSFIRNVCRKMQGVGRSS